MSLRTETALVWAAKPGMVAGLHGALKPRIKAVVDLFDGLETKGGTTRAPETVDGWLDFKSPELEQYPFAILRPSSGVDSEQGADENSRTTVKIIVGTYSEAIDGWRDVLMLIDAIRDDLLSAPAIDKTAYEMVGPLTWEMAEQQPYPQWLGTITTVWTLPRPQRIEARNPTGEI